MQCFFEKDHILIRDDTLRENGKSHKEIIEIRETTLGEHIRQTEMMLKGYRIYMLLNYIKF